jgi:hypothetical protein
MDVFQDEIERSVREVNQLLGYEKKDETERRETADKCTTYELSYLKVEARHLNPNNEFKRMFGSKIVNTSAEFKYIFEQLYINTLPHYSDTYYLMSFYCQI